MDLLRMDFFTFFSELSIKTKKKVQIANQPHYQQMQFILNGCP